MIYLGTLLLLLGAGIYAWIKIVDQTMFRLLGLISPSALELLKMNSDKATKVFFIVAFALIAVTAFASFVFSRRIAGPLFAFIRHLKRCEQNGRLEEFYLRKGDLFVDLTDSFNRMVQKINSVQAEKSSKNITLKPFGMDISDVEPKTSSLNRRRKRNH